ncbi:MULTISPECIES: hypothetical protein [unclassified Paludibacterium]|uniref:hypothetical protein n=1 Tax=unclassified Paludibacterium TaxID=2618429 RepID=UPI001C050D9A|nr:hypothetical protein [Paludibacterium sp. B53371]BEV73403.1 hypothetical protein THUN1379_28850 [Paludibacterium sp. THUN1379]
MNTHRLSVLLSIATIMTAAACMANPLPGSVVAPKTFAFDGKSYRLAFSHTGVMRSTWEYGLEGEDVQNWQWTSLVTITQVNKLSSMAQWMQSMAQALQKENPPPRYEMRQVGESQAQFSMIYLPVAGSAKLQTYESDVWIARTACGGIVNLQFARQYPAIPGENLQEKLAAIQRDNTADMARIQALDWQAECQ